jgi:hypothetical protein
MLLLQVNHEVETVLSRSVQLMMTPVTLAQNVIAYSKTGMLPNREPLHVVDKATGTLLPGTMTLLICPPGRNALPLHGTCTGVIFR